MAGFHLFNPDTHLADAAHQAGRAAQVLSEVASDLVRTQAIEWESAAAELFRGWLADLARESHSVTAEVDTVAMLTRF